MKSKIVWLLATILLCLAGCGGERRVDPIPHLLVFLRSENPEERAIAAEDFAKLSEEVPPEATRALIAALQDEEVRVRLQVVKALGNQKEQAGKIVPELNKALELEKDPEVNAAIIQATNDLLGLSAPTGES